MHVVHLYDGHEQVHGGQGSVPAVVWHVARETARAGHDVTVLERRWAGLPASAEHEGVRFERIDLRTGADEPWTDVPYEMVTSPVGAARLVADRTNLALRALWRLREMEYDVLHVHLPFAASVAATVAPRLRDRTVYTAHLGELRLDALRGDDDLDAPAAVSWFSPDVYLAKRAAHTTVLNPDVERAFAKRGVPEDRLSVIPNGVDVGRFAGVDPDAVARVRERYGLGEAPVVLFVGTVMPRKGVLDLVEAAARVAGEWPFRLVIAGEDELDGAYVERVRERVRERGLADRTELAGFVPEADLPALYAAADAFVLPSIEEGFGMTALEAMAAGTPVVGTRVGGLPRLIEDGENGFLAAPGNVTGLARGIEQVLATEGDHLGARAAERARGCTWERIAERFTDVYRAVGGRS